MLCFLSQFARAGNDDFGFNCLAKKFDKQAKAGVVTEISDEKWGYEVTIENKTFKEMAGLGIKYIPFFKQEHLGSKAAASSRHNPLAISTGNE